MAVETTIDATAVPKQATQDRITKIMAKLSLDEKIALMSGEDMWSTNVIEHAGVPKLKMTDGPSGARGAFSGETRATSFPVGVAMAATWNIDLLNEIGIALGEETKTKGAQVLLGPTINLQRTPVGGRNFECYSEDPFLTGAIAAAFIQGVQSQGISACPKHYIANDTEFERHTISSDVDPRTMRELYLAPFETAIKDASAWSIMSAYNRINGVYASSHDALINDLLRDEWGFDGLVVSDWGAALDTVGNANGGLDLEMPGPARTWGKKLRTAVDDGQVQQEVIDQHVLHLLLLMDRVGILDELPDYEETSYQNPAHGPLVRRAAAESMILVKNEESHLPLSPTAVKKLAVIGPNAAVSQIQGGGSSNLRPHYVVNALDGLKTGFADSDISFEPGCLTHKYVPAFNSKLLTTKDGTPGGFTREQFENADFAGEPSVSIEKSGRIFLFGAIAAVSADQAISIKLSGTYTPEQKGLYTFGLSSAGLARLFIDNAEVVDNWTKQTPGDSFFGFGSAEQTSAVELEEGREYDIRIEFVRPANAMLGGMRFGVLPPVPSDILATAVHAANDANTTILVLGSNADWETEGTDRTHLNLPGQQNALAEAVLDADPNAIIIMNAGSPMEMPWFDRVKTLIWAWFPGQEFGNALFDVITGAREPSGRSPISFPKSLKDHPAFAHYPGVDGHMPYEEGLFIGYRHYDLETTEPALIPFGHGLGYAQIDFTTITAPDETTAGNPVNVSVSVKNRADRAGSEVIQLYVHPVNPALRRPQKELKAFHKITIAANGTETVDFALPARAFSYWDEGNQTWQCDPGAYEIRVGKSAQNIILTKMIHLTAT